MKLYSKLTQLQVKGATDRSQRQLELAELANRLEMLETRWKESIRTTSTSTSSTTGTGTTTAKNNQRDEDELQRHFDAIHLAYEEDPHKEASPFMVSRLAKLSSAEYKSIQTEKALRRLHNDQRSVINWLHEEIEKGEQDKVLVDKDIKCRVQVMKKELVIVKKKYVENLQAILALKRQELVNSRSRLLQRLDDLKRQELLKANDPVYIKRYFTMTSTNHNNTTDNNDVTDWIDLDDDYFPTTAGGNSEWVVCS